MYMITSQCFSFNLSSLGFCKNLFFWWQMLRFIAHGGIVRIIFTENIFWTLPICPAPRSGLCVYFSHQILTTNQWGRHCYSIQSIEVENDIEFDSRSCAFKPPDGTVITFYSINNLSTCSAGCYAGSGDNVEQDKHGPYLHTVHSAESGLSIIKGFQ